MGNDLTCRVAVEADLPAIVALLGDDEFGATRTPDFELNRVTYQGTFATFGADNHVIVAELNTAVVGCYQLTFIRGLSHGGSTRAQIESVRIALPQRGKGLGSRLMQDAIARAKARDCHLVQLTTDTRRAHTRRFYERLGFLASHHGMKLHLR